MNTTYPTDEATWRAQPSSSIPLETNEQMAASGCKSSKQVVTWSSLENPQAAKPRPWRFSNLLQEGCLKAFLSQEKYCCGRHVFLQRRRSFRGYQQSSRQGPSIQEVMGRWLWSPILLLFPLSFLPLPCLQFLTQRLEDNLQHVRIQKSYRHVYLHADMYMPDLHGWLATKQTSISTRAGNLKQTVRQSKFIMHRHF